MVRDTESRNEIVVPAVGRALDILEFLGTSDTPQTTKEISKALHIPPTSTYRVVKYLCRRGYIDEDTNLDGRYSLGLQVLHLARLVKERHLDLRTAALHPIRRLAQETGQAAQLGVLHEYGVMYIDMVLPATPVSIIAPLRTVLPINVSASGKVLVAYLPSREREDFLLNASLATQTAKSITSKSELAEELRRVRELGYATDSEEYARGIGCLATPVFDDSGTVIAAVGITGHVSDYEGNKQLARLIQLVQKAAAEISRAIGYETEC